MSQPLPEQQQQQQHADATLIDSENDTSRNRDASPSPGPPLFKPNLDEHQLAEFHRTASLSNSNSNSRNNNNNNNNTMMHAQQQLQRRFAFFHPFVLDDLLARVSEWLMRGPARSELGMQFPYVVAVMAQDGKLFHSDSNAARSAARECAEVQRIVNSIIRLIGTPGYGGGTLIYTPNEEDHRSDENNNNNHDKNNKNTDDDSSGQIKNGKELRMDSFDMSEIVFVQHHDEANNNNNNNDAGVAVSCSILSGSDSVKSGGKRSNSFVRKDSRTILRRKASSLTKMSILTPPAIIQIESVACTKNDSFSSKEINEQSLLPGRNVDGGSGGGEKGLSSSGPSTENGRSDVIPSMMLVAPKNISQSNNNNNNNNETPSSSSSQDSKIGNKTTSEENNNNNNTINSNSNNEEQNNATVNSLGSNLSGNSSARGNPKNTMFATPIQQNQEQQHQQRRVMLKSLGVTYETFCWCFQLWLHEFVGPQEAKCYADQLQELDWEDLLREKHRGDNSEDDDDGKSETQTGTLDETSRSKVTNTTGEDNNDVDVENNDNSNAVLPTAIKARPPPNLTAIEIAGALTNNQTNSKSSPQFQIAHHQLPSSGENVHSRVVARGEDSNLIPLPETVSLNASPLNRKISSKNFENPPQHQQSRLNTSSTFVTASSALPSNTNANTKNNNNIKNINVAVADPNENRSNSASTESGSAKLNKNHQNSSSLASGNSMSKRSNAQVVIINAPVEEYESNQQHQQQQQQLNNFVKNGESGPSSSLPESPKYLNNNNNNNNTNDDSNTCTPHQLTRDHRGYPTSNSGKGNTSSNNLHPTSFYENFESMKREQLQKLQQDQNGEREGELDGADEDRRPFRAASNNKISLFHVAESIGGESVVTEGADDEEEDEEEEKEKQQNNNGKETEYDSPPAMKKRDDRNNNDDEKDDDDDDDDFDDETPLPIVSPTTTNNRSHDSRVENVDNNNHTKSTKTHANDKVVSNQNEVQLQQENNDDDDDILMSADKFYHAVMLFVELWSGAPIDGSTTYLGMLRRMEAALVDHLTVYRDSLATSVFSSAAASPERIPTNNALAGSKRRNRHFDNNNMSLSASPERFAFANSYHNISTNNNSSFLAAVNQSSESYYKNNCSHLPSTPSPIKNDNNKQNTAANAGKYAFAKGLFASVQRDRSIQNENEGHNSSFAASQNKSNSSEEVIIHTARQTNDGGARHAPISDVASPSENTCIKKQDEIDYVDDDEEDDEDDEDEDEEGEFCNLTLNQTSNAFNASAMNHSASLSQTATATTTTGRRRQNRKQSDESNSTELPGSGQRNHQHQSQQQPQQNQVQQRYYIYNPPLENSTSGNTSTNTLSGILLAQNIDSNNYPQIHRQQSAPFSRTHTLVTSDDCDGSSNNYNITLPPQNETQLTISTANNATSNQDDDDENENASPLCINGKNNSSSSATLSNEKNVTNVNNDASCLNEDEEITNQHQNNNNNNNQTDNDNGHPAPTQPESTSSNGSPLSIHTQRLTQGSRNHHDRRSSAAGVGRAGSSLAAESTSNYSNVYYVSSESMSAVSGNHSLSLSAPNHNNNTFGNLSEQHSLVSSASGAVSSTHHQQDQQQQQERQEHPLGFSTNNIRQNTREYISSMSTIETVDQSNVNILVTNHDDDDHAQRQEDSGSLSRRTGSKSLIVGSTNSTSENQDSGDAENSNLSAGSSSPNRPLQRAQRRAWVMTPAGKTPIEVEQGPFQENHKMGRGARSENSIGQLTVKSDETADEMSGSSMVAVTSFGGGDSQYSHQHHHHNHNQYSSRQQSEFGTLSNVSQTKSHHNNNNNNNNDLVSSGAGVLGWNRINSDALLHASLTQHPQPQIQQQGLHQFNSNNGNLLRSAQEATMTSFNTPTTLVLSTSMSVGGAHNQSTAGHFFYPTATGGVTSPSVMSHHNSNNNHLQSLYYPHHTGGMIMTPSVSGSKSPFNNNDGSGVDKQNHHHHNHHHHQGHSSPIRIFIGRHKDSIELAPITLEKLSHFYLPATHPKNNGESNMGFPLVDNNNSNSNDIINANAVTSSNALMISGQGTESNKDYSGSSALVDPSASSSHAMIPTFYGANHHDEVLFSTHHQQQNEAPPRHVDATGDSSSTTPTSSSQDTSGALSGNTNHSNSAVLPPNRRATIVPVASMTPLLGPEKIISTGNDLNNSMPIAAAQNNKNASDVAISSNAAFSLLPAPARASPQQQLQPKPHFVVSALVARNFEMNTDDSDDSGNDQEEHPTNHSQSASLSPSPSVSKSRGRLERCPRKKYDFTQYYSAMSAMKINASMSHEQQQENRMSEEKAKNDDDHDGQGNLGNSGSAKQL